MKPTILLTFANDLDAYLDELKAESHAVYKLLEPLKINGKIQVERDESATLEIISSRLKTYRESIAIFHYAGHASGKALQLEDGAANADGLAHLIAKLPNLQLVVLNGCATFGQVEKLLSLGVKAVIATSVAINDTKAREFATQFYEALANQQNIQQSYQSAVAFLESKYSKFKKSTDFERMPQRALKLRREKQEKLPWTLHYSDEKALQWHFYQERDYNKKNILTLMLKIFNDEDLQFFCEMNFEAVSNNFASGQSKKQRILALFTYCKRFDVVDKLLNLLEEENPAQFDKFKPYF
jgi:hypothetical protein